MIQLFLISILIFAPIARGSTGIWSFAPIQILTLLAAFFCTLKLFSQREIKRTGLDVPILAFLFIFIIASFNSCSLYASITEFIRLLSLAAIFYMVVNFMKKEAEIKKLLNAVLITSTAVALFGILQYLGVIDNSWWAEPRFLSATYVNHNHFAGLMELSIPLCVGMILSEKETGKKTLYVYSFLVMCVALLLSMSRGGWLSLALAMIFMFVAIFKKGRKRFALFILILLLATFALFIFNMANIDLLLKRVSSYGELDLSGRALIWEGTLDLIKGNWLLGTGPGTFIYNFPAYRVASLNMLVNFAHNDYLQVFSEMGIFGLGLMLLIIGVIIGKGLRTHNKAKTSFKKWISLSLSTAVLSLAIHAIGDFNFYITSNAILFTVFSGLIFAVSSKREKDYPPLILKPRPIPYGFLKSAAFISTAASIIFISSSLTAALYSNASTKALSASDLDKAEEMAVSASRTSPVNYIYPYRLAGIYYKKGAIEESAKAYKEALRLNPMDAWSWIGLADAYYERYKRSPLNQEISESAASAYRKAVELDPLNSYYLKKFAGFLLNTGDSHLSGQMYKKASYVMTSCDIPAVLVETFTDGEAYLEAANLAFSAQDYNKSFVFYKMAEEFLQTKERAQLGQVRAYIRFSSVPEALTKFKETISSRETRSTLFAALSGYYLRKGFMDTAERFSERAILLDPKNLEAYHARYELLRKVNVARFPKEEVSKILSFNQLPVAFDLAGDVFELEFEVKKALHRNGSLDLDITVPSGIYEFIVKARGREAQGIWPHMEVKVNDKRSLRSYIDNKYWDFYSGIAVIDYPLNRFEIIFDNDYYDSETKEDRNLYVDSIKLKALHI